jgi:hypothetical protein
MTPLLAPLLALALAAPTAIDPYEAGLERYREADYMGAADAFRLAVAHPASEARQAKANVWLGVCLFNISEVDAARLAFKSAMLYDRTLTLPDEAPPTAQPLFDDVRRSLPPDAGLTRPAGPAPPQPKFDSDFTRPAQPNAEGPVRPWMAAAALGVAGGLGVTAGALELGCHANFNAASSARYAPTANQLIARGQSEQDAARGVAIAAGVTLIGAAVLYFLSH